MTEMVNRRNGDCLTDEAVFEYLGGTLDPLVRLAYEQHFAGCEECCKQLAASMRLLQQQTMPEEDAVLATLNQRWNDNYVQPPMGTTGPSQLRRALLALAGMTLLLGIAILVLSRHAPKDETVPNTPQGIVRVLAAGLAERPFEARLAEQPYVALPQTRGASDVGFDEGLVAEILQERGADAYTMGRYYFLTNHSDRALPLLEQAARSPDATPSMLNDLGAAYLSSFADKDRLQKAADALDQALAKDPFFAPAIFNRALCYQYAEQYAQAARGWERYLAVESASGWADEAREQLVALTELQRR